ncbi:hypothetical protein TD95_000606 [Thielaviopsis punctulata]|uniref:chitin synthase n=1 Tax=Thielaviopsis punctulata TaxID=72032 RepID=A0A0F4ZKK2_9PEZI|nr:hypothetical protein TD95_000606 [Thielaviopsis punctulata]
MYLVKPAPEPGWPVREIVYSAVMGVVMLVALVEWVLWVTVFSYCLTQVFRKAEHWTIRVLCVTIGCSFWIMRLLFLPVMLVTLPLPSYITGLWPADLVGFLQWFAFWMFTLLLIVPSLVCIWELSLNRLQPASALNKSIPKLTKASAPKIAIVMPVYQESLDVLVDAIQSIVHSQYPKNCMHLFVSFDSDDVDGLFKETLEKFHVSPFDNMPTHIDIACSGVRITFSRFPHAGKRACQQSTYNLFKRTYAHYGYQWDNVLVLFMDSDCRLDSNALRGFAHDMYASPGNSRRTLAMTGLITASSPRLSLLSLLQDVEYVHGQLFDRAVESGCGAVTCLPGALTIVRYSAFDRMAPHYFAPSTSTIDSLFNYARTQLGEDRWLTHLFMIGAKRRGQLRLCTTARCKTAAVSSWTDLVKQRRRWFLGFIANEAAMLTDCRLWRRYPVLLAVRFLHDAVRTTALVFFVLFLALATSERTVEQLPVGFLFVSLGLNWLLMLYFAAVLHRFKVLLYPVMFVVNPFLNLWYMVYAVVTASQRTWGGPRASAGETHGTSNVDGEKREDPNHDDGCTTSLVQPPDALDGCLRVEAKNVKPKTKDTSHKQQR